MSMTDFASSPSRRAAPVVEFRAAAVAASQTNAELPPALSCVNLGFNPGGVDLMQDVSFSLPRTGLTAIMGANGAGKSLLLRMLHGLLRPTSGDAFVGGRSARRVAGRGQAMVFQRPVLLRRTVAANLDFVLRGDRKAKRARRRALLAEVGLENHEDRPARRLSGGEQQRLAFARALVDDPRILFMDEPTASLDPASIAEIERATEAVRDRGTKVLLITHDIAQARRLADDVLFLHRGRLMEHTPAGTFFTRPESEAARALLDGKIYI